MKIKGIDNVNRQLAAAAKKAETLAMSGMIKAAIIVRRDMESTPPKTPIDTSNLRHSFFITTSRSTLSDGKFKGKDAGKMSVDHAQAVSTAGSQVASKLTPSLIMGFSARYAAAVHEGKTKKGGDMKYKRLGAGAKFFEMALKRNSKTIEQLTGTEIRKGL